MEKKGGAHEVTAVLHGTLKEKDDPYLKGEVLGDHIKIFTRL